MLLPLEPKVTRRATGVALSERKTERIDKERGREEWRESYLHHCTLTSVHSCSTVTTAL
jgi:hypothetical protein